ncbi:MAG: HIT family protein [Candidatus Heimdallarchaeota archaeon]
MRKIWAPWRIEYIQQEKSDDQCFICDILKEDEDKQNLILFRGETAIVMLNKFPYIAGHLMVAPKQHTAEINSIPPNTYQEMWELMSKSIKVLEESIKPEGFNIGINLGKVSGAGLKTHIHIHVVPRWSGDTNFMPILTDTRVISEALDKTFEKIMKHKDIFEK